MHPSIDELINSISVKIEQYDQQEKLELEEMILNCAALYQEIVPRVQRKWTIAERKIMYDRQDGVCPLCNKVLDPSGNQVDHIIPQSRGGGHELSNVQLAHSVCNQSKSNRVDVFDLLEYLEKMEEKITSEQIGPKDIDLMRARLSSLIQ
jgi:5-methylcytosine-specific restriction endonuclease McrA